MSNELANTHVDCLPATQGTASLQQTGQRIYNIKNVEHAGDIHNDIVIYISSSVFPGMPGYIPPMQQSLNPSRYHLLVKYGETFDKGYIEMDKTHSLTESGTCESFREKYVRMTDEVIEELKTYPALFMSETSKESVAFGNQYVYWGIITDIKRMSSTLKIYFHLLTPIPLQRIIDIKSDLDILGTPFFGEMNHSHWSLKDVNILNVFSNFGINVMAPTL